MASTKHKPTPRRATKAVGGRAAGNTPKKTLTKASRSGGRVRIVQPAPVRGTISRAKIRRAIKRVKTA